MKETRSSFLARLKPFLSPSTLLEVDLAYTLAKFSHRAQVRKELDPDGKPVRYFEHLRRVALVLIDEAKIIDPTMIIAALLHDGIEDTRDLTPEMIEHCFGNEVVRLVKLVTKDPKDGYIQRMMIAADWRAIVLKLCDRLDNVRSLEQASREFQQKQVKETQEVYMPLFQSSLHLIPTQYKDSIEGLLYTLADEVVRAHLRSR